MAATKTMQDLINNAKTTKAGKGKKPVVKAGKPTIKQGKPAPKSSKPVVKANGKFKGIVVAVTAEISKGKEVTLNVTPKNQDADVTRIKSRARQVMRRYLRRLGKTDWQGFSTELLEGVEASKAQKMSAYKDPKTGAQRFAVCP